MATSTAKFQTIHSFGGLRKQCAQLKGKAARSTVRVSKQRNTVVPKAALDWSDPDVQIGALGAFFGVFLGIGAPLFYISRDERDEKRLEELRALNRATYKETGEYLSPDEIEAIRPARWTDRREFVDDD